MKWAKWLQVVLTACLLSGAYPIAAKTAYAAQQETAKWPVKLQDVADRDTLLPAIKLHLTQELSLSPAEADYVDAGTVYELNAGGMPDGYSRQFLAFPLHGESLYVYLLATDAKGKQVRTLGEVSESDQGSLVIHTSKLEISIKGNRIAFWSQAPFRAFQSEAVLTWDGKKLNIASHVYSDPTETFFEQKEALLKKGDLQGLIQLENRPEGDYVQYPTFYERYYSLAGPVLKLFHNKALEFYRKGDAKTAVSYLHYGLTQYAEPFELWDWETGKLTSAQLNEQAGYFQAVTPLSASTVIGMLNDYGFFLSEVKRNKEAKPILLNVIRLAPSRTVAYLNAADVEWALGDKKAAKAHYQKYLKLLGHNASKAPKRVKDRINAK